MPITLTEAIYFERCLDGSNSCGRLKLRHSNTLGIFSRWRFGLVLARKCRAGVTRREASIMVTATPSPAGDAGKSTADEGLVQVLLRLAAGAPLYRSSDGSVHVRVTVGGRHEVYGGAVQARFATG